MLVTSCPAAPAFSQHRRHPTESSLRAASSLSVPSPSASTPRSLSRASRSPSSRSASRP
ncbi:hypothetical protein BN1723_020749 [Verticillium longisporum]|uniref:Uncharacterized protein n=1 Tax=Verticillium longisporum TaxID=100787 RepID=A0A0G4MUI8_VERLO|nr:hypothetical protein BN1708_020363 [Verticillium longisporum]CRK49134.1 hypothetical protein BN1723_020749 [Verticillium longisporum]